MAQRVLKVTPFVNFYRSLSDIVHFYRLLALVHTSHRKFGHILKYLKFYVAAVTRGRLMFSLSTIYE